MQLVKAFFTRHGFDVIDSVCTGETLTILGNKFGFAALKKKEISNLKITHCFIYGHTLTTIKCFQRFRHVI